MANDVERMYYGGNQAPSSGVTRDDLHKFIMKIVQAQGPAGTFEYDPLLGNTAYFSLLSLMYKGHPLGRYSPIDPDGQVRTAIEIPYEPGVVTIPTSESDIQTKVQSALNDDKFPVLTDNSDYYVYSGKTQGGDDVFFKIEGTVITTAVVDSTDTVTQTSVDLAGFIETVECASGPNIDAVGTPSVSAVNDPVLHKTTLTFNYLKGEKGDQGNPGTNGTNGTSAYWFKGTAVTGTGTGISAVVGGSEAGDMYLNSNTQDVYIATAANTWDYVCNIKGATGEWGGIVDQNYNATSANPQSGKAVADAVADKADNTPTFTEASTRVNLNGSNETMPTILGKVKKWFTDLKALAFKSTVGTSDIDDDAITAAKVKDNETLPVSISGMSGETRRLFGVRKDLTAGVYTALLKVTGTDTTDYVYSGSIFSFTMRTNNKENVKGLVTISPYEWNESSTIVCRTLLLDSKTITNGNAAIPQFYVRQPTANNKWAYELWVNAPTTGCFITANIITDSRAYIETMSDTSSTAPERLTECDLYSSVRAKCSSNSLNYSKVGDTSIPVYVDTDGSVKECGFQVNFGSTLVAGSNVLNIAN